MAGSLSTKAFICENLFLSRLGKITKYVPLRILGNTVFFLWGYKHMHFENMVYTHKVGLLLKILDFLKGQSVDQLHVPQSDNYF